MGVVEVELMDFLELGDKFIFEKSELVKILVFVFGNGFDFV